MSVVTRSTEKLPVATLWRRVESVGLSVGFLALAVAAQVAYLSPATEYELSVYRGTPMLFWGLILAAMLVGLAVAFHADSRRNRGLALLLVSVSMLTIVALPLIRQYYLVGRQDTLTYIGYVTDLQKGRIQPTEIIYPAIPLHAMVVETMTGYDLPRSLMLLTLFYTVSYVCFVPLAVRVLDGEIGTVIPVVAALMLLPINWMSIFLLPHPASQAILFLPALLFAYFAYLSTRSSRYGLLFAILSGAFVLLHPQQAGTLFVFVGTFSLVRVAAKALTGSNVTDEAFHFPTLVLGVFTLFWASQLPAFGYRVLEIVSMLLHPQFLGEFKQGSQTLGTKNASLMEIFAKLFVPSLVFCALAGGLMLVRSVSTITDRSKLAALGRDRIDGRLLVKYVTAGFVPILFLFAVYVVAEGDIAYYFRHLAFIMVIATTLGVVAVHRVRQAVDVPAVSTVVRVGFVLLLLVSIPVVHSSPYIAQPSRHVTEAKMSGYETFYEHQDASYPVYGIVSSPVRYRHAISGYITSRSGIGLPANSEVIGTGKPKFFPEYTVPPHFADRRLERHLEETSYLTVTETDRTEELRLKDGVRFDRGDFAYLDSEPGIGKVYSSDGMAIYLIHDEANRTAGRSESGLPDRTRATNRGAESLTIPTDP